MARRKDILAALLVTFVAVGAVQADLMPVSHGDAGAAGKSVASTPKQSPVVDSPLIALPSPEDLVADSFDLHEEQEGTQEAELQTLVDRSNSFDLCLYALIGLGVFRSSQYVKRPSLGFVPEWYHSGAPQQIGHSHAVGPDAFCAATVCFIQPVCGTEDMSAKCLLAALASEGRKSQFTPAALASRGPPLSDPLQC